jgi:hypothetical protein
VSHPSQREPGFIKSRIVGTSVTQRPKTKILQNIYAKQNPFRGGNRGQGGYVENFYFDPGGRSRTWTQLDIKASCVLAPRSSGKENHLKCETFHRNPAGNQSRPAEPGQQPEASLAWWRVTSTAKRGQRGQTLCDRASKCPCREPSSWTPTGAESGTSYTWTHQRAWSHRRRLNMANGQLGFSRNLGDPVVSSSKSRLEIPGNQLQASAAHSSTVEQKERVDAEVPPSEGNEVRRDGRQEVVAL